MRLVDEAVRSFMDGFSCSQAVFSTYGVEMGLSREHALKTACAFGGGMGHTGEACGAVTGALMVIGLKFGATDPEDKETKEKTYEKVNEFMTRFKNRNRYIHCTPLLGHDLTDPDVLEMVKEQKLTKKRCPKFIQDAAEILEEIL